MAKTFLNTIPRTSTGAALDVYDNGDGTSEVRLPVIASAATVRVIDQATTPADITVATNETVQLTPNGAAITVSFAAPVSGETIGVIEIFGGTSAITWSGPVETDWPGGAVPDTTAGRHRVSCARTATTHSMAAVAFQ